ncbi:endonuclease/exonuclease/phosphatase family protein [Kitasatospora acidiphila]|uniref:Endonuclease/exonuclease/phosphatase family protein n=1 Tax=Kitasatospora acidiphila TaxID=2567942 RepID=A0A540WG42_9ACTN|nr:endonuclease/exonuclease/phosphatase family protein [Kitasatospora acidiphila]TQF01978.1 endonuclease/exonuclease/phosphatase family protein [Kitasatospora acidiphila]TQF07999.1 endonuclease/exonuclease/phosphatase family protein [Kitasatospora acidiphila]
MAVIVIGSLNLEHDGFTPHPRGGGHFDKWYAAHEFLSGLPLDALFRQEMTHTHEQGGRLLHEAERMLSMRGFLASATPESPNPTGLFVREDTFSVTGVWPQSTDWWHAPCAISVRYGGVDVPLQLASVHLSSRSPERRQIEARNMTTWQRRKLAVLTAGDFNSYSASGHEQGPFPDWPNLEDRGHQERRTRDGAHTDTEPDRILTAIGLADPAVHAALQLGQADALTPTASMRPAVNRRQGPPQRIDRQYVSRALLPALKEFKVVPLPEWSDHAMTVSVWDAELFMAGLHRHPDYDYRTHDACPAPVPAT